MGSNGCQGGRVCKSDGSGFSACDCGNANGAGGDAATGQAGSASGGLPAAASGAGGSGGHAPVRIPVCASACTSAADCGSGTAADDADNYLCTAGTCVARGCLNDTECASQSPGTRCRTLPNQPYPSCVKACGVAADCFTASPAFDADNLRCADGVCQYTGCNNNAECEAIYPGKNALCADNETGVRACYPGCQSAEDCSLHTPLADANNYRCDSNRCIYLGCQSNSECMPTYDICVAP